MAAEVGSVDAQREQQEAALVADVRLLSNYGELVGNDLLTDANGEGITQRDYSYELPGGLSVESTTYTSEDEVIVGANYEVQDALGEALLRVEDFGLNGGIGDQRVVVNQLQPAQVIALQQAAQSLQQANPVVEAQTVDELPSLESMLGVLSRSVPSLLVAQIRIPDPQFDDPSVFAYAAYKLPNSDLLVERFDVMSVPATVTRVSGDDGQLYRSVLRGGQVPLPGQVDLPVYNRLSPEQVVSLQAAAVPLAEAERLEALATAQERVARDAARFERALQPPVSTVEDLINRYGDQAAVVATVNALSQRGELFYAGAEYGDNTQSDSRLYKVPNSTLLVRYLDHPGFSVVTVLDDSERRLDVGDLMVVDSAESSALYKEQRESQEALQRYVEQLPRLFELDDDGEIAVNALTPDQLTALQSAQQDGADPLLISGYHFFDLTANRFRAEFTDAGKDQARAILSQGDVITPAMVNEFNELIVAEAALRSQNPRPQGLPSRADDPAYTLVTAAGLNANLSVNAAARQLSARVPVVELESSPPVVEAQVANAPTPELQPLELRDYALSQGIVTPQDDYVSEDGSVVSSEPLEFAVGALTVQYYRAGSLSDASLEEVITVLQGTERVYEAVYGGFSEAGEPTDFSVGVSDLSSAQLESLQQAIALQNTVVLVQSLAARGFEVDAYVPTPDVQEFRYNVPGSDLVVNRAELYDFETNTVSEAYVVSDGATDLFVQNENGQVEVNNLTPEHLATLQAAQQVPVPQPQVYTSMRDSYVANYGADAPLVATVIALAPRGELFDRDTADNVTVESSFYRVPNSTLIVNQVETDDGDVSRTLTVLDGDEPLFELGVSGRIELNNLTPAQVATLQTAQREGASPLLVDELDLQVGVDQILTNDGQLQARTILSQGDSITPDMVSALNDLMALEEVIRREDQAARGLVGEVRYPRYTVEGLNRELSRDTIARQLSAQSPVVEAQVVNAPTVEGVAVSPAQQAALLVDPLPQRLRVLMENNAQLQMEGGYEAGYEETRGRLDAIAPYSINYFKTDSPAETGSEVTVSTAAGVVYKASFDAFAYYFRERSQRTRADRDSLLPLPPLEGSLTEAVSIDNFSPTARVAFEQALTEFEASRALEAEVMPVLTDVYDRPQSELDQMRALAMRLLESGETLTTPTSRGTVQLSFSDVLGEGGERLVERVFVETATNPGQRSYHSPAAVISDFVLQAMQDGTLQTAKGEAVTVEQALTQPQENTMPEATLTAAQLERLKDAVMFLGDNATEIVDPSLGYQEGPTTEGSIPFTDLSVRKTDVIVFSKSVETNYQILDGDQTVFNLIKGLEEPGAGSLLINNMIPAATQAEMRAAYDAELALKKLGVVEQNDLTPEQINGVRTAYDRQLVNMMEALYYESGGITPDENSTITPDENFTFSVDVPGTAFSVDRVDVDTESYFNLYVDNNNLVLGSDDEGTLEDNNITPEQLSALKAAFDKVMQKVVQREESMMQAVRGIGNLGEGTSLEASENGLGLSRKTVEVGDLRVVNERESVSGSESYSVLDAAGQSLFKVSITGELEVNDLLPAQTMALQGAYDQLLEQQAQATQPQENTMDDKQLLEMVKVLAGEGTLIEGYATEFEAFETPIPGSTLAIVREDVLENSPDDINYIVREGDKGLLVFGEYGSLVRNDLTPEQMAELQGAYDQVMQNEVHDKAYIGALLEAGESLHIRTPEGGSVVLSLTDEQITGGEHVGERLVRLREFDSNGAEQEPTFTSLDKALKLSDALYAMEHGLMEMTTAVAEARKIDLTDLMSVKANSILAGDVPRKQTMTEGKRTYAARTPEEALKITAQAAYGAENFCKANLLPVERCADLLVFEAASALNMTAPQVNAVTQSIAREDCVPGIVTRTGTEAKVWSRIAEVYPEYHAEVPEATQTELQASAAVIAPIKLVLRDATTRETALPRPQLAVSPEAKAIAFAEWKLTDQATNSFAGKEVSFARLPEGGVMLADKTGKPIVMQTKAGEISGKLPAGMDFSNAYETHVNKSPEQKAVVVAEYRLATDKTNRHVGKEVTFNRAKTGNISIIDNTTNAVVVTHNAQTGAVVGKLPAGQDYGKAYQAIVKQAAEARVAPSVAHAITPKVKGADGR